MAKRRFLASVEKFGIIPITDTLLISAGTYLNCALNAYLFVSEVYSYAFIFFALTFTSMRLGLPQKEIC